MRKITFVNNEFYHLYNRGVDKRKIFLHRGHYKRFIQTIHHLLVTGSAHPGSIHDQSLALFSKLSFIVYCLMPNHYHFLVRQLQDGGMTEFMHRLSTSYTKYFNQNNERTGRLFEYTFKAVYVETDEQLLHLSRYIHLNPLLAGLVDDLPMHPWSSYPDYIGVRNGNLCQTREILGFFARDKPTRDYEQFVLDQIDYAKELAKIKDLLLE